MDKVKYQESLIHLVKNGIDPEDFEKGFPKWAKWKLSGETDFYCDSGNYIWKIKEN
jgi:hypothetical protein